ncbi:hypothetical protein [Candidatus Entotheonella palauensis]|uniref:hypothetical protein n=1 Tax=Candidatus Entotheonella palauensis TaxID=93172 RepID=UPI000B7CD7A4|nr:hypothetical protein [Candidatus Entotheonella palauensis]
MNAKFSFFSMVLGFMLCLLGAVLLWASGSYAAHQQHLSTADRLAADGRFAEASQHYEAAEADYTNAFWGIPQGAFLQKLDQFGFDSRTYVQLRRAEMAFREGERLLSRYGEAQPEVSEPPDPAALKDATASFKTAAEQYQPAQGQSQEPFWQFLAQANHARTLVQLFLIEAFLAPEPQDPSQLKQHLTRAIKSLQNALNAIYTDQVRVSSADERNLVMLLESLTRFQRREDVETAERQRVDRFFQNMLSVPEVTPFGEFFRSSDLKSLSNKTGAKMRDLLLNQRPDQSAREQTNRPSEASRTGRGSADSGSEGKTH